MKGLGSINFLSTALMAITISFVGYTATESAQAQPVANTTTMPRQQYNSQDAAKITLVRKFYEALSTGNTALIDEALAYDWVDRPTPAGLSPGRAGGRQLIRRYRAAFPDFKAEVEDVYIDGEFVVVRAMGYGTQNGEFLGIPATGRRARFMAIDIHRIANNRIAETWNLQNLLSVVQQLGATIKPPSDPYR